MTKLRLFLVMTVLYTGGLSLHVENNQVNIDRIYFPDDLQFKESEIKRFKLTDSRYQRSVNDQTNYEPRDILPNSDEKNIGAQRLSPDDINACFQKCPVTDEYNPICGTNGVTYVNPSRLVCATWCGTDVGYERSGPCTGTEETTTTTNIVKMVDWNAVTMCTQRCPVTAEFNPVCGTNGVTYANPGRLACANFCGVDVGYKSSGRCSTEMSTTEKTTFDKLRPGTDQASARGCVQKCPITSEYNPVCGTNGVTYANPGRLICAIRCGVDVLFMQKGQCPPHNQSTTS